MGGVFTRLIERNTTIPTHKSQIFSTAADGQTSVEVHVLQGEREMAAYNKTLGRFQLGGIAPAPRGVPQIEVTFDIDANGIVKVSAKDLGTGKEANISITASTNLSKDDIEKAVREAEQYAAEDKARREEVDTHNNAEHTVYQMEKTLNDLGDKVTEAEKAPIQAAIEHLKEVNKGSDVAAIKTAIEEAQKAFYPVAEKLYSQANPQGDAGCAGDCGSCGSDGVVDADYETVD
jgi:molecular chaperone DnaK